MKKLVLVVAACLLASTAFAQQLKTAQGITIETYTPTPEPEPKKILPIEKGFEQSVELGASTDFDGEWIPSAEYIAGYRLTKNIFVGGGTGIEWLKYWSGRSVAMPLYATIRAYTMSQSRWQPVFGLSVGAVFRIHKINREAAHPYIGLHLNPTIGVNYRITQKYSCYCTLGYIPRELNYDFYIHCLSVKLGFTF